MLDEAQDAVSCTPTSVSISGQSVRPQTEGSVAGGSGTTPTADSGVESPKSRKRSYERV